MGGWWTHRETGSREWEMAMRGFLVDRQRQYKEGAYTARGR